MNEKAVSASGRRLPRLKLSLGDAAWAGSALLLELGSGGYSTAPSGAAFAAGLPGRSGLCAMLGACAGALLHGFPAAFSGLIALAVVLVLKAVPEFRSSGARLAVRTAGSAAAVFISRLGDAGNVTALFRLILAALASEIFTACVCVLAERVRYRGFDVSDTGDCAFGCAAAALAFLSLGALDYSFINIGRLVLGALILIASARYGLKMCAVIGVSGVLGLCACSPGTGAGGAIFAFAAFASAVFAKYGKLSRAAGYVFLCVTAALITGIDEGSWRILTESVISGAAFALIPAERAWIPDGELADASVSYMLRERLNFAADAISAVGAGLRSASETLDRKYNVSIEDIPERAADRCCRSCPNCMVCWGKNYDMFTKEFARLVTQLRAADGSAAEALRLSPECAALCVDPDGAAEAIRAEYSRFVSVKADERRVRELRRVYVDHLSGVRDILRDMASPKGEIKCANRYTAAERRAEKILREGGMELPQAFVTFDRRGRLRLEAYAATEPRVEPGYLGALLSRTLDRELDTPQITGGGGRYRLTAGERTLYTAKIGAYQIPKGNNRVCGDCWECFTDAAGIFYVILSDGMGSGARARVDSAMACSVLSKLLRSGVSMKAALETVNTALMVKSADESFATLDICSIDLNSGEGVVYKAGAAATYIKSSDKLIRASLSSSPAGTGGELSVPAQKFSVGEGDVIIMMTDGAAPDEQWLSRELSQRVEPKELSERIARAARMDSSRDDDISVIALLVTA